MAAGHIVNGQCVGVASSSDYLYSGKQAVLTAGPDTYMAQFHKMNNVTWNVCSYKNGVNTSCTPISIPAFGTCDTTTQFFDGLTIGWGVAAAMVAAWAIHAMRRAIT